MLKISNEWQDYECLDAGNSEKLERWGKYIIRRPDPSAMWQTDTKKWTNIDAIYHRSDKGGGYWQYQNKVEDQIITYKDLKFKINLTNFKHTGLFPEQGVNWDFMQNKIKNQTRKIKVLNLFAYTGGATIACSKAGADVTHVDASKGIIKWAKENQKINNLENNYIRYIVDDCLKFVQREERRGHKYDAIIMDPPSYGRGPNKEVWKFEKNLRELLNACIKILSDDPLFIQINSYTTGVSNIVLYNMLKITMKDHKGKVESGEVGLPITNNKLILPCGIYGRWTND